LITGSILLLSLPSFLPFLLLLFLLFSYRLLSELILPLHLHLVVYFAFERRKSSCWDSSHMRLRIFTLLTVDNYGIVLGFEGHVYRFYQFGTIILSSIVEAGPVPNISHVHENI